MKMITRRNFIKQSAMVGMAVSTMGLPRISFAMPDTDTVLVVIMLTGGPDFRYLFVPPYEDAPGTYGQAFWTARAPAYELSPLDTAGLEAIYNSHLPVGQQDFRIHPDCHWLQNAFNQGNVALVSNVFASANRNHSHSILMLERGDLAAGTNETSLSGWGGRLAQSCDSTICSVSGSVRQFCFGPHPTDPLDHDNSRVIDGEDTRAMGLYEYETDLSTNGWRLDTSGNMSRALTSYYAAKGVEMDPDSPFYTLVQHEQSVRKYGRMVNQVLETVPIPQALSDLYTDGSGNTLANPSFGKQMLNIYDTMACEALLGANIISAEYGGWDHHRNIKVNFEPKIHDIFGNNRGLHTLYSELQANQPGKSERLVFLIYGEFGRQLAANGNNGIDHGVGNYALLIGDRVNGGVYGDMFPAAELPKFAVPGTDIEGLTSYEHVIARICENLKVGSADAVVPGWQNSALEAGVDLSSLFV